MAERQCAARLHQADAELSKEKLYQDGKEFPLLLL